MRVSVEQEQQEEAEGKTSDGFYHNSNGNDDDADGGGLDDAGDAAMLKFCHKKKYFSTSRASR